MSRLFALVENAKVANIVIAEHEWVREQPGTFIEIAQGKIAGIGWAVSKGVIITPAAEPPPAVIFIAPSADYLSAVVKLKALGLTANEIKEIAGI